MFEKPSSIFGKNYRSKWLRKKPRQQILILLRNSVPATVSEWCKSQSYTRLFTESTYYEIASWGTILHAMLIKISVELFASDLQCNWRCSGVMLCDTSEHCMQCNSHKEQCKSEASQINITLVWSSLMYSANNHIVSCNARS